MNQRAVPPPSDPKPSKLPKPPTPPVSPISGPDREFLPAALEILETPPSPLPVAMMLTICAFIAVALGWSFIGHLDVHAVAPGKVETAGRAKVIQPLEPGKISAIHVENGSRVKAGDVLLELDPAEAMADENSARGSMTASLSEVARRRYAVQAARAVQDLVQAPLDAKSADTARARLDDAITRSDVRIAWDAEVPEIYRLRERSVLGADLGQLGDVLSNIDKQMAQKEATRQRLQMSIAFQDTLMVTLKDRVSTRQEAINLKVGTKINLYDAKEQLEKSQSQLASDQGQMIEADAAISELRSQKTKVVSQFIAENENKLDEASRKADEARQAFNKASARVSHARLVAPIDGVAQQLSVTTVGQVVTTGQQLLMVTPSGGALQVEALVANIDIGFVKLGQEAAIKVDAFPFTRFGVLKGKVVRIASEAVNETEAKRTLANAVNGGAGAANPTSAPGQPDSFVFPVTVELEQTSMRIGDTDVQLAPGMTASVEIKTDSRRVIDYLLSPLAKVGSEAMRER